MSRIRYTLPLLTVLLGCSVLAFPAAAATDRIAFPYAGTVGMSAYGGDVVWSQYDSASMRWTLRRWHGGVESRVPIPSRDVPFDADVGPDVSGRPVVVYSRCAVEPDGPPTGFEPSPAWARARGCHLHEFDLLRGRDHRLRTLDARDASDTTPAIWRGSVAFVRRVRQGYPEIVIDRNGRVSRLPTGSVPRCERRRPCAQGANVAAMDLGPHLLAFLWQASGANVTGLGTGWELRADSLTGRATYLLSSGELSGECGYSQPVSPNVVGPRVAFLLFQSACQGDQAHFMLIRPGAHSALVSTPPEIPLTMAQDGKNIYWAGDSLAGPSRTHAADDCVRSRRSCALLRSRDLPQQVVTWPEAIPVVDN